MHHFSNMRCLIDSLLATLLLVFSCFAFCADPVKPGQDFSNALLKVSAPNSEGWLLAEANAQSLAFAKRGVTNDESYAALVSLFTVAGIRNPDQFLEYVKQGIESDRAPDRFTTLENSLTFTESRPYLCVKLHNVSEDRAAQVGSHTIPLRMETFSLYCRHPKRSNVGFSIGFSQRGGVPDDKLESRAQEFIDGIQAIE
ncbi:MAG: hypothetical protein PHT15_08190 [Gallionellaceae bacterium]|nr:hypothetical protein [Gallionellaceae bacterium]